MIFLVYDISCELSFKHVTTTWFIDVCRYASEHCLTILVGSKSDLEGERQVPYKTGRDFATKKGMEFIEVSSKSNANVDEVFNIASELLREKYINRKTSIWCGTFNQHETKHSHQFTHLKLG